MGVIQPKFEIKLNTELEDFDLQFDSIDENKMFLSQFNGNKDLVYMTLNDKQLSMNINELKLAVDMLHSSNSEIKWYSSFTWQYIYKIHLKIGGKFVQY